MIRKRAAARVLVIALLSLACSGGTRDEQARSVCRAVDEERFTHALAASEQGASAVGPGREIAECRCIAMLSLGERDACTELLSPLLSSPEANDWVPHPVLSKLMLRTWQREDRLPAARALAARAAPRHRDDLDLLQLEVMLRSQVEGEDEVLTKLEARLDESLESMPQRLVLSLGWNRRARYADALRVLGAQPPPSEHPLLLPWFESRIQAQARSNDLLGVQASFARWRGLGWDPVDLDARYALRLSVAHLREPERDTIELLEAALQTQTRLRDRQLVWGLHRRLITEQLAAGRPDLALEAYDAAAEVVSLEGITREEIVRAVNQASGAPTPNAATTIRLHAPGEARGGTWLVSPDSRQPPDAGYQHLPVESPGPNLLTRSLGRHPLRWVLLDASGQIGASGSIWPSTGAPVDVRADWVPRDAPLPPVDPIGERRAADGRRRVFAILSDCGDWRLTEYLRAREELPFHDLLFEEGYRAVLESRPAFTAAAMQSLVWPSGQGEARDGLSWIHRLGLELGGLESVGRNPVDFLSWVLPEQANLFDTLAARQHVTANMLLAHGDIETGRHAQIIGPGSLRRDLPSPRAYRRLEAAERARYPALEHDAQTQKFAETIAAEMDAAEAIARDPEIDFLFLRLEALDLITHVHFAAIDGRGQDDAAGPLFAAYRYIDERLAALDALLDEDDQLVFLSDHGIRSSMQHEEDALFFVRGGDVPVGRAEGRPALRGVPRAFAAMLGIETDWPDTGVAPWIHADDANHADHAGSTQPSAVAIRP